MKKTILFFFTILVLVSNDLVGQTDRSNVFPPTPEIASIGKFIDQPMSLSRGIPDISIDIYDLKVNDELFYSIGLQYQAGGIKVNEMSGKTGLGWNLNNTGLITRTVKDKPDDFQEIGYMYHTQDFGSIKGMLNNQDENIQYLSETYDFEPDEYTVSANGLNFKFYYNKQTQEFIQAPLSNIKLEVFYNVSGQIISWLVTDINGVKYYFGNDNMVDLSNSTKFITLDQNASENTEAIGSHITSWYLVKIEDTKSNTIDFTYKTKSMYQTYNKIGESYLKNISSILPPIVAQYEDKSRSYAYSFVTEKTLEKIKANDIEVLFFEDTVDRKDFPNNKALKEIQIRNSNQQIRKVIFDYDYFISNNSYPYDNFYYRPSDNFRLKLSGIQFYEGTITDPKNYKFEYNTTSLPNRFSYAQDAWGFFNGKSNSELIPKLSLSHIFNVQTQIGSADRSISNSYAQANILTKITYPTGGATSFEYESNSVGRVVNIQDYPNFFFSSTETRNFWLEPEKIISPTNVTIIDKPEYRKRISINNPSEFINFNVSVEGCTTQLNNSNCMYTVKIVGVNNSTIISITQPTLSLNLPTGEYDIVATKTGNGSSQVSGFTITAYWDEIVNSDTSNLEVGGLRVKKINFYDYSNEYLYSLNYEYSEQNPTNNKMESSGKVLSYPTFIEFPYYINLPKSLKISSNSIFPLSNSASSSVVYTHVSEKRTDKNSLTLGKTEYGFSFDEQFDVFSNYNNTLGNKTEFVMSWRNGSLIYKKDYNRADYLLRTVFNEYSSKNRVMIQDFGVILEQREGTGVPLTVGTVEKQLYRYFFYPFVSDLFTINTSETIDYFNGKPIKTRTEYFYDTPKHYQVTSAKTIQSDQIIKETNYQYAHEKNNQKLINANMIGIPLETT
uniref:hypothetical protein n=1 Tax=Chryseobacterium bernardetii TaxID=1241978 RepID=UPI003AF7ED92